MPVPVTEPGPEPQSPVDEDILGTANAGPRAIRGSAVRTGGYLIAAVLGLASAPLLVRHLGVVDFGRYLTVTSLIALVGGVSDAGLTAVGIREYSVRAGADRDRLMRDLLGARLVLALAGAACAIAFALVAGYPHDMVVGTAVGGAGLMLGVLGAGYSIPLSADLQLGWLTLGELGRQALTTAFIALGVLAGAGLVTFLAIPLPAGLALTALIVVLVRGRIPLTPSFHPAALVPLLKETLPLAAATAMQTLYFRTVIITMSLLATALETGYFATSFRVIEVLIGIPAMLLIAVFPVLARAAGTDKARFGYVLGRLFEVAAIGGVWMALATGLGAEFAIDVVAGDKGRPAVGLLHIQAVALALLFLTMVWQYSLLALRRHTALLWANSLALATTLTLSVILVSAYEATGAALAATIGEGVLMVASAIYLRRAEPAVQVPFRIVLKVLPAAAVALAAALLLDLGPVLGTALATVLYFGILAAAGAIPWEIRDALRR
ncbi:MAG TPA: polysaccharide biosynthesis C-terminal domain-containing protein [Solirubrobacteraceae bacterium]|jgi:O-antigen/teichoic acid export membrane protein